MASNEVEVFNRATAALQSGDLFASEGLFSQLLGSAAFKGRALAGIGIVRLSQGDSAAASNFFRDAIQQGPNADALYGMGVLAEQRGDNQQAFALILDAIRINPEHAGAHARLEALQQLAFSKQPPPSTAPLSTTSSRTSFHESGLEVIITGDDKGARDRALSLLQTLQMKRRPRLSAFFGSTAVLILFFGALSGYLFLHSLGQNTGGSGSAGAVTHSTSTTPATHYVTSPNRRRR